jgi:hypothetical protein
MMRRIRLQHVFPLIFVLGISLAVGPASRAAGGSSDWVLIGLGDSLTHGTLDATNNTPNTANAFLQRMANSLSQRLSLVFSQPFLDDNGGRVTPFQIPTNVAIDGEDSFSIDGLEYYKRAGTIESLPSEGNTADATLPVQFEDKHDAVLYPINVLAKKSVSQMQSAEWLLTEWMPKQGLNRALIVYWVGNNDSSTAALGNGGANPTFLPAPLEQIKPELPLITSLLELGVSKGLLSIEPYTPSAIDRNLTLLSDYMTAQTSLLSRLVNASNGMERHILVLTLPYYSSVGYLMDSDDLEYYFRKIAPTYSVPPSFKRVSPSDPVTGDRISLLTFGLMYALLETGYSTSYVNGVLDVGGVQRDGMVLSEAEQFSIMARIDGFNATLRSVATALGPDVHVAPVGEYLNEVLTGETDVIVGGKTYSRNWIRGSSFSFDGVHPGYVGHSLISNLVLEHINDVLGIDAPLESLESVFLTDPYVDNDNDGFAEGPTYPASGITELLFLFKDPDDSNPSVQADIPANVWTIIARAILEEVTGRSATLKTEAQRRGLFKPGTK